MSISSFNTGMPIQDLIILSIEVTSGLFGARLPVFSTAHSAEIAKLALYGYKNFSVLDKPQFLDMLTYKD